MATRRSPSAPTCAKEAEGDIVTRETRAAEAETASEILAPDASVRADGVADDIHITAWDPLAEIREGIGEGDLHGDVAVERDLRDLRILDAHAAYERLLQADLAVHFFQHIAGALVEFADEAEVGIEEVTDDATEGDELRAVTKAEVLTALFAGGGLQDGKQAMTSRRE